MFNRISVIGLGYIGLPTAAMLASCGKQVIGIDINSHKLAQIQQGNLPFEEQGLRELVQTAVQSGRLLLSAEVQPADVFIIAVPTPLKSSAQGEQPDLSHIESAVQQIAPYLQKGNLVILESTSPIGTTQQITRQLQQLRPDLTFPLAQLDSDVEIAYCPERVLPGNILYELVHNDRIIGGMNLKSTESAVNFYQLFVQGKCLPTLAATAEMCKLAENSYRDLNIAFANELALICEQHGINVWDMIALANHHPRVNILQPSVGVGGHCIAVDPQFLVAQNPEEAQLIRTARQVNNHQPQRIVQKIKIEVDKLANQKQCSTKDLRIACLGLSFKPNVSDLRQSPALNIVQQLAEWHQGEIFAVEPNLTERPAELPEKVKFVDFNTALGADLLLILVAHQPFRQFFQSDEFEGIIHKNWLDFCGAWI